MIPEQTIIDAYLKGFSKSHIMREYGLTVSCVYEILKPYKRPKISRLNHQEVIDLYRETFSIKAVSRKLGITCPTISKILHLNNIPITPIYHPPVKPPYTMLEDEEVIKRVVKSYKKHKRLPEVSEELGISLPTLRKILKNANVKITTIDYRKTQGLDEKKVVQSYLRLKSSHKAGKLFGISSQTVLRLLDKHGVKKFERCPFKVGDVVGKLTILDIYHKGKKKYCLCDCSCGNRAEIEVQEMAKKRYPRRDCKCSYKERLRKLALKRLGN